MEEKFWAMIVVVGLYWSLAVVFAVQGIVDRRRGGSGDYLASAVVMAIWGGLIPPMGSFFALLNPNAAVVLPVILATLAAWFMIGWGIGKMLQTRIVAAWERRRLAEEVD